MKVSYILFALSFFKKKKVPKTFLGMLRLWTPFRVTTSKEDSNH